MKYNRLGTSDIEVSEFTLGCWPFAGGNVWGDLWGVVQAAETTVVGPHIAVAADSHHPIRCDT